MENINLNTWTCSINYSEVVKKSTKNTWWWKTAGLWSHAWSLYSKFPVKDVGTDEQERPERCNTNEINPFHSRKYSFWQNDHFKNDDNVVVVGGGAGGGVFMALVLVMPMSMMIMMMMMIMLLLLLLLLMMMMMMLMESPYILNNCLLSIHDYTDSDNHR